MKNIANDTFEIMLSGDGLQITRTKTNTVNLTFNVINAKDTSTSGLYTLSNLKKLEFKNDLNLDARY